ncbi:MAG: RNA polymerase subunit sigma, partial [Lachnospiraceae bacterium]|nr:RNA polymerase subunit sigma [Lachnospiraceae bacterium]
HLYYYEELSIKEISKCLERKEGTVKSQLARGRALLSRKLGEEFGNGTAL